tara:strand:- start:103 stop:342 length:240 start_codon:yes stop_codon:yes gene_type:complete
MKELIREKRIKHLHLRVFKDVISDEFEIVFTTSEYPYWRKSLKTHDVLLVDETYTRWKYHAFVLQFLPLKFCHNLIVGN